MCARVSKLVHITRTDSLQMITSEKCILFSTSSQVFSRKLFQFCDATIVVIKAFSKELAPTKTCLGRSLLKTVTNRVELTYDNCWVTTAFPARLP